MRSLPGPKNRDNEPQSTDTISTTRPRARGTYVVLAPTTYHGVFCQKLEATLRDAPRLHRDSRRHVSMLEHDRTDTFSRHIVAM